MGEGGKLFGTSAAAGAPEEAKTELTMAASGFHPMDSSYNAYVAAGGLKDLSLDRLRTSYGGDDTKTMIEILRRMEEHMRRTEIEDGIGIRIRTTPTPMMPGP